MQTVLVIQEKDVVDGEESIIGVASTTQKALELIKEYYGEEHTMSEFKDVRDSGIEFTCKIDVTGQWGGIYRLTVQDFDIDRL